MSYHPLKDREHMLEAIPETPETDMCDGSDTDVETGHFDVNADEETLLWTGERKQRNRHFGRSLSRGSLSAAMPLIATLIPWVINFILTVALVSLSWKAADTITSASHQPQKDLMYTLAGDQVEYRLETTYSSQDSPVSEYQGWPNDDNDRLWKDYEKGNRIHIDRETAEKLPHMTEHVPIDEYKDDYIVGLSVFHNLHCLSAIRKGFYPHRYNSSLLDKNGNVDYHKWNHIDHCIENLRRALTCHADTSAMTYDWVEASASVLHPETLHTCRNFDLIRNWAYERYVPASPRLHVEHGKVVSYKNKPPGPAWDKVKVVVPDDWSYTEKDL